MRIGDIGVSLHNFGHRKGSFKNLEEISQSVSPFLIVYTPSVSFVSCVNPERTRQNENIKIMVKKIPNNFLMMTSSFSQNWFITLTKTKFC